MQNSELLKVRHYGSNGEKLWVPPPKYYYEETPYGRAATNGQCVIFERSPVVARTSRWWFNPKEGPIASAIKDGFRSFPLHHGYFNYQFSPFLALNNLEVRGEGVEGLAYLILNGGLIACLMPMETSATASKCRFQFNPSPPARPPAEAHDDPWG